LGIYPAHREDFEGRTANILALSPVFWVTRTAWTEYTTHQGSDEIASVQMSFFREMSLSPYYDEDRGGLVRPCGLSGRRLAVQRKTHIRHNTHSLSFPPFTTDISALANDSHLRVPYLASSAEPAQVLNDRVRGSRWLRFFFSRSGSDGCRRAVFLVMWWEKTKLGKRTVSIYLSISLTGMR
jgi:hypothetical protein